MADHIRILGILHIVYSSLAIAGALIIMAIFGGIAALIGSSTNSPDAAAAIPIVGGIGVIICVALIIAGIPGIVTGIGLLRYRPWARILGIIISAVDLLHVPLGTALGVYGLWVLLSQQGEAVFRNPPVRA